MATGFDYDFLCDNDLSSESGSHGSSCEDSVYGSKIYAGVGTGKYNLSLEFGHVIFGEAEFTETLRNGTFIEDGRRYEDVYTFAEDTLEFSSSYLAAVGIFPVLESWEPTTKLGLHRYRVGHSQMESISLGGFKLRESSGDVSVISDTDVMYGIGIQYVNGFRGIRCEWESFNMELWSEPVDFSSLSLSAFIRF